MLLGLLLSSCSTQPGIDLKAAASNQPASAANLTTELFQRSWQVYRDRFIQGDGRVIDREAEDRSTSEGQAYALIRAVWIDDRDTFDRVLQWSETNLQRRTPDGNRADSLWAWKWGRQANGNWGLIDGNFASDGDIDAITALIWAAKRWNQPQYLDLARRKLNDLWNLSTVTGDAGSRYLLPGPKAAFQPQPDQAYLNPSYFAPYAFRLFAQVDSSRNWLSLVDSSYQVLEAATPLSATGLPSDWVRLDLKTGKVEPATGNLQSRYGFDAYRVWWRVALDAAWFQEPRANRYLQQLAPLQQQWQAQQRIPAQIDLQGKPQVQYESTAQYAMLYAAFRLTQPEIAAAIYQQKLLPVYRDGFWDNNSAYYVQNLSWLGLFPVNKLPSDWFRP
jgi:endoglucanase